jgi:tetratricopeptide (TPR) repeat protein
MELEQLLHRALDLGDEGDWEGTADLLREHLADFDGEPAVHCWLGVAERELGLDGIAYERFKRALALGPEDPHILATAGNGIAAFDDPEAEHALRTAALTAPGLAVARLLYGAFLAREGFLEDARRELDAARALAPEDAQIAYEQGVARYLGGDVDGATDAVGDAVALAPDDGWARVVFGLLLLESGRPDESAGELAEGARIVPEDVEAQAVAALSACVIGADDLAWEMLERARVRAVSGDQDLVEAVEERLEAGPDAARRFLGDELGPDMLRERTRQRP